MGGIQSHPQRLATKHFLADVRLHQPAHVIRIRRALKLPRPALAQPREHRRIHFNAQGTRVLPPGHPLNGRLT